MTSPVLRTVGRHCNTATGVTVFLHMHPSDVSTATAQAVCHVRTLKGVDDAEVMCGYIFSERCGQQHTSSTLDCTWSSVRAGTAFFRPATVLAFS